MNQNDSVKAYLSGKVQRDELRSIPEQELIRILIGHFTDPDWEIRKKSAETLSGFSTNEIFAALKDSLNLNHLDHAFWSLRVSRYLLNPQALALVSEYLKSPDKNIRIYALDTLEELQVPERIPLLIDLLGDPKWSVRKKSADIIVKIPEAAKLLVKNFRHSNEDKSYWIIRILGKLLAERELDLLLKFLKSKKHKERYFAIMALGERKSVKSIPELIHCLSDDLWVIRKQAAEVLEHFGQEAVPFLENELVKTSHNDITYWCSQILARIGQQEILPFFSELYDKSSDDVDLRNYLVMALNRIDSEKIFSLLIRAFDDNYWLIRKQAYEIAVSKGQLAIAPLVLSLDKALRDDNENICHWSIKVLLKLKGLALEPIKRFMKGDNLSIKTLIMMLFYEFRDPATFEILNEALEDGNWAIRNQAARTLVEIGGIVLRKLAEDFSRHTPPIASDRCYWCKKIFMESSEEGKKIYQNLLLQFNVDDLMKLAKDVTYDGNIQLQKELSALRNREEAQVEPVKIAEDERKLRDKVEKIFADLQAQFDEVRTIALNTLLSLGDLPPGIPIMIEKRLSVMNFIMEDDFKASIEDTLNKFRVKYSLRPLDPDPDELKGRRWSQVADRWEKLNFIYLVNLFHAEQNKRDLLDALERERDVIVLRAALKAAPNYSDSLISERLAQILMRELPEPLKLLCIKMLGKVKVTRSAAVLIPLLGTKYKYSAMSAMVELGEELCGKALKDLTYLQEKKDWLLALQLMEEVSLDESRATLLCGLELKDRDLVERLINVFTRYLDERLLSLYELHKTKLRKEILEKTEEIVKLFYQSKIAPLVPRNLEKWKEFLDLLENKEITYQKKRELFRKNQAESLPDSSKSTSEEKPPVADIGEDLELTTKIGEKAYEYLKEKVWDFPEATEEFLELMKVDDSIDRRKDYIFKLQQDLTPRSGGFLERIKERQARQEEIELTERMIVHLLQKRSEKIEKLGERILKNAVDLKNPPAELIKLVKKFGGNDT
ncbi:MAG: HEAT repeat domain-containing protein [Candidatus Wallbacteria bacterium]|nr:HEAT repeat domain-containing protein [Candidatus Wallbacteria bacterium]